VKGALPGIPMEIGARILKRMVAQAFEELDMEHLRRNWLQVVARAANREEVTASDYVSAAGNPACPKRTMLLTELSKLIQADGSNRATAEWRA
jgi:hypothetical protein